MDTRGFVVIGLMAFGISFAAELPEGAEDEHPRAIELWKSLPEDHPFVIECRDSFARERAAFNCLFSRLAKYGDGKQGVSKSEIEQHLKTLTADQ